VSPWSTRIDDTTDDGLVPPPISARFVPSGHVGALAPESGTLRARIVAAGGRHDASTEHWDVRPYAGGEER
jgi:hypothetical protein